MRETIHGILCMEEARGIDLEVRHGSKHHQVYGRIGDTERMLCVVALGKGKSDTNPQKAMNYRAGVRKRLAELREAALETA